MTILNRIALVFISLLIFFLIGESCFRIFKGKEIYLHSITGLQGEGSQSTLFKPSTSWPLTSSKTGEFDVMVRINNYGFRGKDINLNKDPGQLRIFVVGDSFAFGVGTGEDETIPYLIEKQLLSQGYPVEVINAGQGNSSALTHYLHLRDIFLRFEPDLIMYLFDFSDLWDDWYAETHIVCDKNGKMLYVDPTVVNGKTDWWLWMAKHSEFSRWIHNKPVRTFQKIHVLGFKNYVQAKKNKERAKAAIVRLKDDESAEKQIEYDGYLFLRGKEKISLIEKNWQRSEKYLDMFFGLLRDRDIPFVLVDYPYGIHVGSDQWREGRQYWGFEPDKVYDASFAFGIVKEYAKKNGIPYIDTLDDFRKNNGRKLFFDLDGHLTPAGNEVLSQSLVNNPVFRELIDKVSVRRQ